MELDIDPSEPASASEGGLGRQRQSVSSRIYRDLYKEIVSLHREPASPLDEKGVAAQYGVSRTPVREALLRLYDDGLIDLFPQSGTYVSRIPVAILKDATIIRQAIEEAMARLAAEARGSTAMDAIEAAIKTGQDAASAEDRHAFHAADDHFHDLIARAANHPRIWTLAPRPKMQIERYRRATLPQAGRFQRVLADHLEIASHIRRGDVPGAVQAMRQHVQTLISDIMMIVEQNPTWFDANGV
jgi:GntR family transcriptional regulator, rspAB operon transcriptional repressor